ncbi:hypothetical protein ACNRD9_04435 [Ralstonia pseudosolanacearum]|uniref:hypothetical protein n=1 Tax=Ralstonia pseudosolanacearum TaxID=1310165 RepID=UPI0005C6D023|nr:hypothetical protein [Ralstonia pseudosolanacearum]MCK4150516.1 hypothetical protein [Ralstonia pseudosolanacearum]BCL90053.1 hypothetical protein MAFF211471_51410 [Ralstonia solanacearum]BCN02617.1 hypothetical protein RPSA_51530 [Ralstonia solanacearum]
MTSIQLATSAKQCGSLFAAFPAALHREVTVVAPLIGIDNPAPPRLPVVVRGESLNIPYRIRLDAGVALSSRLSEVQTRVYACALTRHLDGHVRQRHLAQIVTLSEPWIVPFVVQLCGEYVIEILEVIEKHLTSMHPCAYGAFFRENPRFFQQTQDRMVSYWDCYYRWLYKRKADYVGFRLFDRFRDWSAAA